MSKATRSDWAASSPWSGLQGKPAYLLADGIPVAAVIGLEARIPGAPGALALVAYTGKYSDLLGKPMFGSAAFVDTAYFQVALPDWFDQSVKTDASPKFAGGTKIGFGESGYPELVLDGASGGAIKFTKVGTSSGLIYAGNGVFVLDTVTANDMDFQIAGASKMVLGSGGGLKLGVPTGGDKGTGTLNVSADIYRNNTAYTNPDYVLEKWATGRVKKFASKPGARKYNGVRSLKETEKFARKNFHLPGFGQEAGHGLFSGSDQLLLHVEELYIHLFKLSARVESLEKKLRSARVDRKRRKAH